jgi:hypothetical protein
MSFAGAVKRAGSFEALRPHLREGRILSEHFGLYSWPEGEPKSEPGRIPRDWWAEARVDPATGRVIFRGSRVSIRSIGPDGDLLDNGPVAWVEPDKFAFDIRLEGTAVETLFPVTTVSAPQHVGGRDPDHNWEDAARHVDAWVEARGPLPRHKTGKPILARAVELMTEWFDDNDPPAPKERSIRRWIAEKPRSWWGPN